MCVSVAFAHAQSERLILSLSPHNGISLITCTVLDVLLVVIDHAVESFADGMNGTTEPTSQALGNQKYVVGKEL